MSQLRESLREKEKLIEGLEVSEVKFAQICSFMLYNIYTFFFRSVRQIVDLNLTYVLLNLKLWYTVICLLYNIFRF